MRPAGLEAQPRRRSGRADDAFGVGVDDVVAGEQIGIAPQPPQRIVSLAPSLTEIVFALGFGDRLVGVSSQCDHPPEVRDVERVGSFVAPAVERIVAARPNQVLAEPNVGNRQPVESLQRLGLEVVVVRATTLAEMRESFVTVARHLGAEERGRELVEQVDAEMAATVARLGDVEPRRTLLVMSRRPLIAAGSGTLQHELLEMARATNLGVEGGTGWPTLSIERVIAAAPEVIIDASMGEDADAAAALAYWSAYPTLPAVRAGRVTVDSLDTLLRPGPRIGEALEALARAIHPPS